MTAGLLRAAQFARRRLDLIAVATAVAVGLFYISQHLYLLFHALVEVFGIVIAFTVFMLTWNTRRNIHNGYLVFLGISFFFVACLDLLHALAYPGMGVFPRTGLEDPDGANLATQLWLAARYMQSLAMVIAPFYIQGLRRPRLLMLGFAAATALLLMAIFPWRIFPVTYAGGLTPFKLASEYVIILFFLAGAGLLLRNRGAFAPYVLNLLLAATAANVLAELAFTGYSTVSDLVTIAGHYCRVIAYFLIYKAIVEVGLRKPQELLYRELAQSEQTLRAIGARERERAAELEAVMDAVPAVVWITHDPEARYINGNPAASAILRMTGDANLSKTAPEGEAPTHFRVYQDGRELAPEELPLQVSARSGKPVRDFEEQVVFDDGEVLSLFGNVTPLLDEDGRPAGAVAAFIDITARVKAEQALRSSESRLRRLVDSNIIGVVHANIDGSITLANDAFLDIVGYTRADFEAGLVNWRKMTPPEFAPIDLKGLAEADQSGACTPYEKEYYRKDGSRVPILLGYAYFDEPGKSYIAFVIDLSERKRAEAAVKEYAAQLEQSNRELQDFAFVASHDLQEPLRKIQAFGDRLQSRLDARLDEESRDYLARMLSAAHRMRIMINDLLALSRVTTRGRPFRRVDLGEVAREVISDLEPRIERSRARVEVGPLPVIEADATQMHQLLQNLVVNALKFHRSDSAPVVRLYGELSAEAQQVKIIVQDNGIGFDEQYADRIFQPFQRLHGRTEFEGSGIGLAICRKIAERHGGTITARSVVGQGSIFCVTLPGGYSSGGHDDREA